MTTPRLLATAALLLTAATLTIAGCSSGTGTTHAAASQAPANGSPAGGAPTASATAVASPTSSPTGTYRDQVMAWARQFAACVRAHGIANFPDPVYPAGVGPNGPQDTGLFPDRNWGADALFPVNDKVVLGRALALCPDLVKKVPPAPDSLRPPTAQEMAIMRQFSQCMRRHGFHDFPDPRADGTFPILNGPYASLHDQFANVPRALDDAYLACQQRWMPMNAS
jgi:hypothetical protein